MFARMSAIAGPMLPDSSTMKTTSPFGSAAVAEATGESAPASTVVASNTGRHAIRGSVITRETVRATLPFSAGMRRGQAYDSRSAGGRPLQVPPWRRVERRRARVELVEQEAARVG